jgi:ABC-type bacteriocin/lantibiotic exporter with double-glycine peptidase domain
LEQSYSTARGLSLSAVQAVSQKVGLNYQMAFRSRGAPIVFPAVVHWGLGHYAAIVDKIDDRYLVEDSTFGDNVQMTSATLDEEASGYFLIPAGPLPRSLRWR